VGRQAVARHAGLAILLRVARAAAQ